MLLTVEQKRWVTEELCPKILREEGRGFAMATWLMDDLSPGTIIDREVDNIPRIVPVCGAVACIGGTMEMLLGGNRPLSQLGEMLGLSYRAARRLFYDWDNWPAPFAGHFRAAKTPLGKAQSAVALLHAIVDTDGAVMDLPPEFDD